MNHRITQQNSSIGTQILSVISNLLPGILGAEIVLVLIPVCTGDKRFNQ